MTMPSYSDDRRSELAKVRGLGSAKYGTQHWIMQRFSAVVLIAFFIYIAFLATSLSGASYLEAVAVIANPVHAILLSLFIIAGFYHGQLGLQVVIEDYIHKTAIKIGLIWAVKLSAVALATVGIFSILRLAL